MNKKKKTNNVIVDTLNSKKAVGFVASGVKILMAVVMGASLLGGTYTLYDNVIKPTTQSKVEALFNYGSESGSGSSAGSDSSSSGGSDTGSTDASSTEEDKKNKPIINPDPISDPEPEPEPEPEPQPYQWSSTR